MIDTHAHLYAEEFDTDRNAMLQRAQSVGVTKIVLPNVDSASLQRMLKLESEQSGFCYAAIGVHPTSIGPGYEDELAMVEQELKRRNSSDPAGPAIAPYIAIGEIGTDLYWDKSFVHQQQKAFACQLQWSLDYHLPVIIHVRDSFDATFEVLQDFKGRGLRGVFHSFTGTAAQAYTINEFGTFYLGVNGIVTFKNSGLRDELIQLSPEKLLLETDAPYLSPVPYRGKRNESSYLALIAGKLAEVYSLTTDEIVRITTQNANSLFNFK
jgi:TatD DNase family protein